MRSWVSGVVLSTVNVRRHVRRIRPIRPIRHLLRCSLLALPLRTIQVPLQRRQACVGINRDSTRLQTSCSCLPASSVASSPAFCPGVSRVTEISQHFIAAAFNTSSCCPATQGSRANFDSQVAHGVNLSLIDDQKSLARTGFRINRSRQSSATLLTRWGIATVTGAATVRP